MRSKAGRALLGAALLIAAVVLFVVLQDGGDGGTADSGGTGSPARAEPERGGAAKPSEPAITVIAIEHGKPVGGVEELEFAAGERIRFEVDSDVGDEIHVHGYDVSEEVEAGDSVRFDFPATIEGVFEVELEDRAEPIAELRVSP
jgi:hypothetical protein